MPQLTVISKLPFGGLFPDSLFCSQLITKFFQSISGRTYSQSSVNDFCFFKINFHLSSYMVCLFRIQKDSEIILSSSSTDDSLSGLWISDQAVKALRFISKSHLNAHIAVFLFPNNLKGQSSKNLKTFLKYQYFQHAIGLIFSKVALNQVDLMFN